MDETGIFSVVCQHGIVQFLLDMVQSGELWVIVYNIHIHIRTNGIIEPSTLWLLQRSLYTHSARTYCSHTIFAVLSLLPYQSHPLGIGQRGQLQVLYWFFPWCCSPQVLPAGISYWLTGRCRHRRWWGEWMCLLWEQCSHGCNSSCISILSSPSNSKQNQIWKIRCVSLLCIYSIHQSMCYLDRWFPLG